MVALKLFKNRAKSNGERFSPCLTPILQLKKSDSLFPSLMQDLAVSYILNIILNNLPFNSYFNNDCQRSVLFRKSKAFFVINEGTM